MEHKLIQGGEQWLPFARNRIKAMRATGLPYASQTFDMGDGSRVRTWITPAADYIRIDGGNSGIIYMDSGVIDMRSANAANLLRFAPGIFYDTQKTAAYKAAFSTPTPSGEFLLNHAKTKNGQFAGDLHGQFAGYVQANQQPPRSYAPLVTVNGDGTITTEKADEALADKKISAKKYPASCFTGRMRKYVQAAYGQPLYDPDATGEKAKTQQSSIRSWANSIPGLVIPYAKETPAPVALAMEANASAGVVKTKDGSHWLVNIASDRLYIYPLKGSPAAERARPYIADASNKLSMDDKDKLESYILASSRPLFSGMAVVDLGGLYSSISMGYGWHWNWSGTVADIVIHSDYDPGTFTAGSGADTNVESQHFRLTLSPAYNEKGKVISWSASARPVGEAVKWGLSRRIGGIAYPVWGSEEYGIPSMAGKLNAKDAHLMTAKPTIYAYYAKDELVLCVLDTIASTENRTAYYGTPGFSYQTGSRLTEGDKPGFRAQVVEQRRGKVSFSVGGETYVGSEIGFYGVGAQEETTDVSRISGPPSSWTTPFLSFIGLNIQVGYPSSYEWVRIPAPAPGDGSGGDFTAVVASGFDLSMKFTTSEITTSYLGKFDIIIPFNDAEAVLVSNRVSLRTAHTSRVLSECRSMGSLPDAHGFWRSRWVPIPTGPTAGDLNSWPHQDYLTMVYGSATGNITDATYSVPDQIRESVIADEQRLHTRAGVFDASLDLGFLTEYQTPALDFATPVTTTMAGASFETPVIISPHLIGGPLGFSGTPPTINAPTIVGWA